MPIVGVRYDERLIHGQVVTFWTNGLSVDRIVVLDEQAATDPVLKSTLKIAVPSGVKTSIILKEKFMESYMEGKYGDQRLLVIFRDFNTVQYLIDHGADIKEINLGNRSAKKNQEGVRLSKNFFASLDAIEAIIQIHDQGINIVSQLVPRDPVIPYEELKAQIDKAMTNG